MDSLVQRKRDELAVLRKVSALTDALLVVMRPRGRGTRVFRARRAKT